MNQDILLSEQDQAPEIDPAPHAAPHKIDYELKGHPERWFCRDAVFSIPGMLLVGDAAGVDPLLGEGISQALMYGGIAAETIVGGIASENLTFDSYRERLFRSYLGRDLTVKWFLAKLAYGPFHHRRVLQLSWIVGDRIIGRFLSWRLKKTESRWRAFTQQATKYSI